MTDLGSLALDHLVQTTLRGAVLAAAVGLGLRAARVADVRLRHLAWASVMAAMLAMPVLRALLPSLDILPRAGSSATAAALSRLFGAEKWPLVTAGGAARIATLSPNDPNGRARSAGAARWASSASGAAVDTAANAAAAIIAPFAPGALPVARQLSSSWRDQLQAAIASSSPQAEPMASARSRGVTVLLALYAAGALLMLASLVAGRVAAARLLRRSRLLTPADRAALWEGVPVSEPVGARDFESVGVRGRLSGRLAEPRGSFVRRRSSLRVEDEREDRQPARLAMRRRQALPPALEVRESSRVTTPFTLGFWRPVLLLPIAWRDWDRPARAAVLLHEAAHVARRDWAVQWLSLVNRALFWFNPLSWWLHRQLTTLAEHACDDAALAAAEDRYAYARTLLDFLAHGRQGRVIPLGVSMSAGAQWDARIERILDTHRHLSRPARAGRIALTLLAGAPLVWFVAGARMQAASPIALASASVPATAPASSASASAPASARGPAPASVSAAAAADIARAGLGLGLGLGLGVGPGAEAGAGAEAAAADQMAGRGHESSLAARWRNALAARTGDAARQEVWLAYVVPTRTSGVTSNAGFGTSWGFRDAARAVSRSFASSTYASIYADAWRAQAIRAPSPSTPTPVDASAPPGGGRRVAFLFHLSPGASSAREIDGVKLRGLSEPLDIDPSLITWLGEASAAESLPFLADLYARLPGAHLQKEIPCAVTVHDDAARVLAAIEPYLDVAQPAAVRSEAVQWLGRTRRDEAARRIVARVARTDPDAGVRSEARDLIED